MGAGRREAVGRGLTQATPRLDPGTRMNFHSGSETVPRSTNPDHGNDPGLLGYPRGERGSTRAGREMLRSWGPVRRKLRLWGSLQPSPFPPPLLPRSGRGLGVWEGTRSTESCAVKPHVCPLSRLSLPAGSRHPPAPGVHRLKLGGEEVPAGGR